MDFDGHLSDVLGDYGLLSGCFLLFIGFYRFVCTCGFCVVVLLFLAGDLRLLSVGLGK